MKTHIIENGIVTNTILATVTEAQSAFPGAVCIDGAIGGIGWAWDGETLTAPTVAAPTPEEIQSLIIQAVQLRLDTFAQSRNYDSILSASTYATSAILKFQTEGQAAVNARDNTWATLYTILGEVQGGERPMPTGYAAIEAELPTLEWPV